MQLTEQRSRDLGLRVLLSLLLALLTLGLAGACGKKEAPLAPEAVLPGTVRNFALFQDGETLVLRWDFPRENQLGQPLTNLEGFRLERRAVAGATPAAGCSPDFVLLADIDLDYPQVGRVQGETVVYQDKNLEPGKCYSYRVATSGRRGGLGSWSQVLSHAWGILPRAPGGLTAEAGDREVQLSWPRVATLRDGAPVQDLAGYVAVRRSPKEAWRRLTPTPLAATTYQDVAVENEVEYTYTIRAVRRLGAYALESPDSVSRTVIPQDLTPPPPPLNLVAAVTPRGIELRWDPSPVPDAASYRVYRLRAGEASAVRLTPEPVKQPYFVDTQAARGQTYYYAVTAVDDSRRRNESQPSEEAAVRH
jgi:hypothetical protein